MSELIEEIANIFTITQVVFIILKLTNLINWSWWLVLLPSIITFGIGVLLGVIIGIIILLNQKKMKKEDSN